MSSQTHKKIKQASVTPHIFSGSPSMKIAWGVALFFVLQLIGVYGVGVNWGTQAAQSLDPSIIVQLLKDNHIDKIKLFDSDPWMVNFFADTGIDVMLGIPNNQLAHLADSYDNAKDWVNKNLTKALHKGVKISHVAVGNEPFLKSYNGSNLKTTFPAVKNIQQAINEHGLGDVVKATIPQNADVYETSTSAPSDGNFRSDIKDLMTDIVKFFDEHNCPFLVNIYPFLSLYYNPDFPLDFAFFDGGAQPVQDNGTSYDNMFDANLDILVWSLKKAGVPKVKIIVGEIGWPTDGHGMATPELAQKFYNGWFKKMATKKGTPKYPGEIDYYLFSLTDENQKSIAPGDFERHWGIFSYDGRPKFEINMKGNGSVMPIAAKGVEYLDSQWCVYNTDVKLMDHVKRQVKYACTMADCTTLDYNSTCSTISDNSKISYAFNSFFQSQNQDVRACDFQGTAKLVENNASVDGCLFPLALESAAVRPVFAPLWIAVMLLLTASFW